MKLMLGALIVLSVLELLLYLPVVWTVRKFVAPVLAVLLGMLAGAFFMLQTDGWSYLGLVIMIYRCLNLVRVAQGISAAEYLRHSGWRTSWILMVGYGLCLSAWAISHQLRTTGYQGWLLLGCFQLGAALVVLSATRRTLRRTLPPQLEKAIANRDLPSISVAIPARNETTDLQECLESLLACDYPKLEVLVLDDCSQDRTSEVIKDYAHAGVRFLKGTVAAEGWLAKNWAYEQLYTEANGTLIIFGGVDIRFDSASLRSLVTTLLTKQKRMLCIMPENVIPSQAAWRALLIQPMRYAWELSLPRRLFKRPPVLSSCWIAERALIKSSGSFAAVKRSISPESHFARQALAHDGYSFVRSTAELKFISKKPFSDQYETAVRTRYPQLHRRPELVLLVGLIESLLVVATWPLAIVSLCTGHWLLAGLSVAAAVLYSYSFQRVTTVTYHRPLRLAWLAVTPAVMLDIALRNYSMYRYEFSAVIWKGRNVCLPVMQVIPRLPPV